MVASRSGTTGEGTTSSSSRDFEGDAGGVEGRVSRGGRIWSFGVSGSGSVSEEARGGVIGGVKVSEESG